MEERQYSSLIPIKFPPLPTTEERDACIDKVLDLESDLRWAPFWQKRRLKKELIAAIRELDQMEGPRRIRIKANELVESIKKHIDQANAKFMAHIGEPSFTQEEIEYPLIQIK